MPESVDRDGSSAMDGFPARALSASAVLAAWEKGRNRTPTGRALAMLAAAYPEVPIERLAELNIGRRDSFLLALREHTFGPRLEGETACPTCGRRLELTFDAADVRADLPDPAGGESGWTVSESGWEATFRLPTSRDLQAARSAGEADARRTLLRLCITDARNNGESRPADSLPAEIAEAVGRRMEQADPQANIHLDLVCPDCGHSWRMLFDIVPFLWNEIRVRALRLLHEVHLLASAYGWREADILAMSPGRRRIYLEMATG
jgi:hypothetical protein